MLELNLASPCCDDWACPHVSVWKHIHRTTYQILMLSLFPIHPIRELISREFDSASDITSIVAISSECVDTCRTAELWGRGIICHKVEVLRLKRVRVWTLRVFRAQSWFVWGRRVFCWGLFTCCNQVLLWFWTRRKAAHFERFAFSNGFYSVRIVALDKVAWVIHTERLSCLHISHFVASYSFNFDLHSSYLVPSDFSASGKLSPAKKCQSIWSYNPIEEEYNMIEEPAHASPFQSRPPQLMRSLYQKRGSDLYSDQIAAVETAAELPQNFTAPKTPKKQYRNEQIKSPKGDSTEEIRWETTTQF